MTKTSLWFDHYELSLLNVSLGALFLKHSMLIFARDHFKLACLHLLILLKLHTSDLVAQLYFSSHVVF